jgi:hypothetical protein
VAPGIASCTLAESSEQGCAFQAVGGAEVDRDNSKGELLFSTQSQTFCVGPVQWASIQLHRDL